MVKRLALICCLLLEQTGHVEFSLLTFKSKKKKGEETQEVASFVWVY